MHMADELADEMSDEALLERWRAGDPAAGNMLFGRYYPPILRFFHNKAGPAAGDLIQATFLGCLEAVPRLKQSSSFRAFIFAIAHYRLYNHYRDKKRIVRFDSAEVTADALTPSPSQLLAASDEQHVLLLALRKIPIDCQVVIELHYWERLAAQEIAEIVGVPIGTVKSRLRRARELLRERIAELAVAADLKRSTLGDIEGWVAALRARLGRPEGAGGHAHGT